MAQYRIKQYNPGAWCIDELIIHGEKSKTPGREEWRTIKYPGNLKQAASLLLSLVIGFDEEMDVVALINAINHAERAVALNVADYVSK